MSRERLATAYDNLAEAYAAVAHELRGIEPAAPPAVQDRVPSRPAAAEAGVPPAPVSAPSPAQGFPDQDKCPSHGREWKDGNYGPFCTAKSDDPAWSNKNGYCTITPKNAPKWLEIHKPAAAMDVDDVAF